jgi:hypothetical protein
MTDETVIITPEMVGGGIGDYTRRLIEHLPRIPNLRLMLPSRAALPDRPPEGYRIEQFDNGAQALRRGLPDRGGRVLLQYSAYGFDRFGYPRSLIRDLVEWKKESGGRLAIMFHEIWTFWPVWNKNYLPQRWHRGGIRRLLGVADSILTSTPSQAEHLHRLSGGRAIEVLPVGSNIVPIRESEGVRQPGAAVLFGLQPGRIRALEKMRGQLSELIEAGAVQRIVTAGAGDSPPGERKERTLLSELSLPGGFEQRGELPEAEISALLLNSAFAISAQDELSLYKSGTFMAYASHALNIISICADASKPEPVCLLTSPQELLNGMAGSELTARARRLRDWQRENAAWPHIASQIGRALKIDPAPSPLLGATM